MPKGRQSASIKADLFVLKSLGADGAGRLSILGMASAQHRAGLRALQRPMHVGRQPPFQIRDFFEELTTIRLCLRGIKILTCDVIVPLQSK